jgi:TPR repeat protein
MDDATRAQLAEWAQRFADVGMAAEASVCRAAASSEAAAMRDAVALREAAALLAEYSADSALLTALYRPVAEAGDPDAMAELGELLYRHSMEDGHHDEGWVWLQRALDAGSIRALTHVAYHHEERGRLDEAERLYLRGVDAGDPMAMIMLANMFNDNDEYDRAEVYYRRAIEAGNTTAMSNLGTMLHQERRWAEAARLYRRAVEAGDGLTLRLLIRLVLLDDADIEELCARCETARPLDNNLRGFVHFVPMDDPRQRLTKAEVWPDATGPTAGA